VADVTWRTPVQSGTYIIWFGFDDLLARVCERPLHLSCVVIRKCSRAIEQSCLLTLIFFSETIIERKDGVHVTVDAFLFYYMMKSELLKKVKWRYFPDF
jgi:hypothetical protein